MMSNDENRKKPTEIGKKIILNLKKMHHRVLEAHKRYHIPRLVILDVINVTCANRWTPCLPLTELILARLNFLRMDYGNILRENAFKLV